MTAWDTAIEVGRAVYSVGLLAIGGTFATLVWRFGRPVLRVLADLSAAITMASGTLRSMTASQETLARIEAKVDRIADAIVPRT